jgi:hypothetical protein
MQPLLVRASFIVGGLEGQALPWYYLMRNFAVDCKLWRGQSNQWSSLMEALLGHLLLFKLMDGNK